MVNGLDPIQGLLFGTTLRAKKGKFFWKDADQYVVYAQETQSNNFSNYLASC